MRADRLFVRPDLPATSAGNRNARNERRGSEQRAESGDAGLRAKRPVVLFAIAIAALNCALLALAPDRMSLSRLALASVILWTSSYPTFNFLRRRDTTVPIFPAICAVYFIYFGLPVFIDTVALNGRPYEVPEITTALGYTVVALVAMQLAYYTSIGKVAELAPRLVIAVDLERMAPTLLMIAGFGVTVSSIVFAGVVNVSPTLTATINASTRIPVMLLCGLYLLHLRGRLSFPFQLASSACFAVYVVFALGTGALARVALTLASVFFIYVVVRRKFPWTSALICIAIALPFGHSKHEFRAEMQRDPKVGFDRVAQFAEITMNQVQSQGARFADAASKTASERTSHIATLGKVVNETPRRIPYLEGHTYGIMLWSFVPRIIAPDRPTQNLGQDFGHRYGFLHPLDTRTSVNCPLIVELYINFGESGIVIGMVLFGIFYRVVGRLFNHELGGDGMLIVSAAALPSLLNIESDASGVLVGGVQSALFCALILWALAAATRQRTRLGGAR